MLKNILKLEGAQKLSKSEQKETVGGCRNCGIITCVCPDGTILPAIYSQGTAAQCNLWCSM